MGGWEGGRVVEGHDQVERGLGLRVTVRAGGGACGVGGEDVWIIGGIPQPHNLIPHNARTFSFKKSNV